MSKKASRFHVTERDLLCKNHCGFYGNTAWKGYCSVCYKSLSGRQRSKPHHESRHKSASLNAKPSSRSQLKPEQSFAKFEEKRRQQSDMRSGTVKSLFSISSKKDKSEVEKSASAKGEAERQPPARNSEFAAFLNNLGHHIYTDISRKVQLFLKKFKTLPSNSTVEACSDTVQDFYLMINEHINTDPIYQSLEETLINDLLDHLELYLMHRLYNVAFCPTNSDDEKQDLLLHKRIKSLHWVTLQQLEANVNDQDLGVRSALDKSISDIIELDTKRAPKDKLTCIVDCSRKIFDALRLSSLKLAEVSGGSISVASADDFLPVFIFIILKANPSRLKSNINYITRFACPSRLNSGEGGYFFTNMCCVVDFIEKLNAESLNLTDDQFSTYMNEQLNPEGTNTVYMCDGLRLIHENSQMIEKLKDRQTMCQNNVKELELRLAELKEGLDNEIGALVARTPLTLRPARRKADIDTDSDIPTSLPSPLLPHQAPHV